MRVTVIGTGYVGLVTGACLADVGNDVLCIDNDAGKIERLKRGEIPIHEPGLDHVVVRNVAAGSISKRLGIEEGTPLPRPIVEFYYKNDALNKQTLEQRRTRERIVERLLQEGLGGIRLRAAPAMLQRLREDGRGDALDAVLCALQAAWGWQRRDTFYGLPHDLDPVEGWIVTVPGR